MCELVCERGHLFLVGDAVDALLAAGEPHVPAHFREHRRERDGPRGHVTILRKDELRAADEACAAAAGDAARDGGGGGALAFCRRYLRDAAALAPGAGWFAIGLGECRAPRGAARPDVAESL